VNGAGNDEDPMKIFMANLNLIVPVAAAILVIFVAVIVMCFLRGKGHSSDKGNYGSNSNLSFRSFFLFVQARSHLPYVTAVTATIARMSGVTSRGYPAGST